MTDRPILFSAPMIRALLAGRKTQTRRIINFPGVENVIDFVQVGTDSRTGVPVFEMKDAAGQHLSRPDGKHCMTPHYSPRFAKGDQLWVRETLLRRYVNPIVGDTWIYAGDEEVVNLIHGDPRIPAMLSWAHHKEGDTCVSIHMPRWASRLTLTVTDVRVQRLREISEADAEAEGAERLVMDDEGRFYQSESGTYRCGFAGVWSHINGADSWDASPWVVALTFTVERRNIDRE